MTTEYKYECFVTKSQRFGLLDGSGELRCTSPDIEGVIAHKVKVGWGTIIRIEVTDKGITFGEKLE